MPRAPLHNQETIAVTSLQDQFIIYEYLNQNRLLSFSVQSWTIAVPPWVNLSWNCLRWCIWVLFQLFFSESNWCLFTELMFTEFKWGFIFTEYLYLLTWLFVHWIQFLFQVDDNVFFYRRWYGFKVLHWSRNEWFSRIWRCSTPVHATDERDRVFCWWSIGTACCRRLFLVLQKS